MAKKVEIEVDVTGGEKVKGLGQEIRELNKQLRQTPEGTKEWKEIYNRIDDLKDKLEGSKAASSDLIDTLESAPGPLGAIGASLNKLKVATTSFGAALKATGIGLLVSLIGGLVAAFTQTEGSLKKLQPLLIGMEKIFGGIVEVFQPLLDAFLEMALQALPYITKGIGIFYSSLVSLFTLIKEIGTGAGKILKGIFTLDFDSLQAGYNQLAGSWDKTVKSFTDGMSRYEAGTKKMTKTEKENLKESEDARKAALDKRLKEMDVQDKLDEARMEKMKQEALAVATTEREKLQIEKKFAKEAYDAKVKDIEDRQALYKKDSTEYKELQAQKIKAESDFIAQTTQFKEKEKEINKKELEDLFDIWEKENEKLTKKQKEVDEERRGIRGIAIQAQIDELDRLNALQELDFEEDKKRLKEKRDLLDEAERNELSNTDLTEFEKTQIRDKYSKERKKILMDEVATEKAAREAQVALLNQWADTIGNFGNFLQSVAGKNKGLAKAGLVIESAANIAKIVINTQANAAKAGYLTPKGIAELAAGTVGVAAAIAATVKGIREIDKQDAQGGTSGGNNMGKNYGSGGMIAGATHAQGGVMINAEGGEAVMTRGAVSMFGPMLSLMNQAGGGVSFSPGLVGGARPDVPNVTNPAAEQTPIIMKTYVVEKELTSVQERQARLKDLSTL